MYLPKNMEDIQWFDVEYGIYCTRQTGFLWAGTSRPINEKPMRFCGMNV